MCYYQSYKGISKDNMFKHAMTCGFVTCIVQYIKKIENNTGEQICQQLFYHRLRNIFLTNLIFDKVMNHLLTVYRPFLNYFILFLKDVWIRIKSAAAVGKRATTKPLIPQRNCV